MCVSSGISYTSLDMARCSWMICIGLIFLFSSAAAVASESLSNGTRTNVTAAAERDGRAYDVHPPDSTNNQRVEVVQSLSPRPKSLGTGTWKAIKIWNDPVEATSSSTAKRASSPERVVASSSSASRPGDSSILITFLFLPAFMLFVTRLIEELSISPN